MKKFFLLSILLLASCGREATPGAVSKPGGKPQVLDGPFAEAKEMIGGYFILTCDTFDEAVAIARECPAAQWATVEVRAFAPCYDDSQANAAGAT